jgi:hypothetical protein
MVVHGQLHAQIALSPEKIIWYLLDRRLSESQGRSGCCRVEKNLLPLSGIELGRPDGRPFIVSSIQNRIQFIYDITFSCLVSRTLPSTVWAWNCMQANWSREWSQWGTYFTYATKWNTYWLGMFVPCFINLGTFFRLLKFCSVGCEDECG